MKAESSSLIFLKIQMNDNKNSDEINFLLILYAANAESIILIIINITAGDFTSII